MKHLRSITCALLLTTLFAASVVAQLDPGFKIHLYESGQLVGEIFVPERAADQVDYLEHWVLYPNDQYPGPRFIGALLVAPVPALRPYADTTEFFRNAPFPAGSKYIEVQAVESDVLPGR